MLAMSGNRYPMTELGLRRLTQRLIEVGEHDSQFGECDVKVRPGAKINRRDCTCIEVVHPVPRQEFLFQDTSRTQALPLRYFLPPLAQNDGRNWPSKTTVLQ